MVIHEPYIAAGNLSGNGLGPGIESHTNVPIELADDPDVVAVKLQMKDRIDFFLLNSEPGNCHL